MTSEESHIITQYIISVIDELRTNSTVHYVSTHFSSISYKVGKHADIDDINKDISLIKVQTDKDQNVNFGFTPAIKRDMLEYGVDFDDYFNLSLIQYIGFTFDDLNKMFLAFCSTDDTIHVNINKSVFIELLEKEKQK